MMKIVAAIQARMASQRFPGKCMHDLYGKPVIGHVIDQAKKIDADELYLITSKGKENRDLMKYAYNNGIPYQVNDVDYECFYWYYKLGINTKADYIIRICGDSPFIDYDLANILVKKIHNGYDYYSYSINGQPAILTMYGIFVEIFSFNSIAQIMEHTTVPFYKEFNRCFSPWYMPIKYKFSIDYKEDLERAEIVMKHNHGLIPGYKRINHIIEKHPSLKYRGDINQKYEWRL